MTQQELSGIVAEKIQTSEERTNDILDVILSVIYEELSENGIVDVDDFGVFKTQKRSEYISLNSKTGERLLMPPSIEIVFESYLTNSIEAKLDKADNVVQGYFNSDDETEVLIFEPDISLNISINSAFINFEPTILNEGVELRDLAVISDSFKIFDTSTLEDTSTLDDASTRGISLASEVLDTSDTDLTHDPLTASEPYAVSGTEGESNIVTSDPKQLATEEVVKVQPVIKETPPIKQRTLNRRFWIPIVGSVAIILAALFFFNGTAEKKSK